MYRSALNKSTFDELIVASCLLAKHCVGFAFQAVNFLLLKTLRGLSQKSGQIRALAVDMHFLGQYYLDFDNFFFVVQDTILLNGVAQISNKSKRNRRIGKERQVLDAQLCTPTNSIQIDLFQFFFLLFVKLSSSICYKIFLLTVILMLQCRLTFCLMFHVTQMLL